jgi:putative BNR repeat neuraminidase
MDRRNVLQAGAAIIGGGLVLGAAGPARAAGPAFTTMTPATRVAARTDRRPVAGGVYDATVNKTFISWGGQNEDTYVQAYDHATRLWSAPVRVTAGGADSHNYPTLVQAADGRLLIFVGVHNQQLVMSRSAQPHAITGTWTTRSITPAPAASYPMPFRTANGNLFVFYRETTQEINASVPTDTRTMSFVRSTDNGVTWASSKTLVGQTQFVMGTANRSDNMNEVYVGQLRLEPATAGRPERVHFAWTLAGGGPTQHLHDSFHKDIYYATFEPATMHFRSASGLDVGTQVGTTDYDACRVITTALVQPAGLKSPDYIQQVGYLGDGRPFVLYMTIDNSGLLHDTAAVWTGSAWQIREVATGLRLREVERLGPTTWRAYANREGTPNVQTFLLENGQTWTAESTITTAKEIQRVEVIQGFHDPARVLISGASSNRDVAIADGDIYVAGLPA